MATISSDQLARDLAIRDLTDPAAGRHAIQLLIDLAVTAVTAAWDCDVRLARGPRVVALTDNYDALGFPPDAVTRDSRYTRYVDGAHMLRSHATAMIPPALRSLSDEGWEDVLIVCPGVTYRRDAIDRLHTGTPHQLDLWRIARHTLGEGDLEEMIRLLAEALFPGRSYRWEPRCHPYTLNGRQVDVDADGEWVEVWECGLAHPDVLAGAGLAGWTGLALGMGLDRLLMLGKAFPISGSCAPAISASPRRCWTWGSTARYRTCPVSDGTCPLPSRKRKPQRIWAIASGRLWETKRT